METVLALAFKNWRWIAGAIAIVVLYLAAAALKHSYDETRRDEGRSEVQAVLDQYITTSRERTTAITLAWDTKRQAADKLAEERDHAIVEKLAAARRAAATLPPAVAGIAIPAAAVRLLNDAGPAGDPAETARPAGAAPGPVAAVSGPADPPGEESSLGLMVETWRTARVLYEQCVDRVAQIVGFYDALRATQGAVPDGGEHDGAQRER